MDLVRKMEKLAADENGWDSEDWGTVGTTLSIGGSVVQILGYGVALILGGQLVAGVMISTGEFMSYSGTIISYSDPISR